MTSLFMLPGQLDLHVRPGDDNTIELVWPFSAEGHTYSASVGAQDLPEPTANDEVLTLLVPDSAVSLVSSGASWSLKKDSVTVIGGNLYKSSRASSNTNSTATVVVNEQEVVVNVLNPTAAGEGGGVSDHGALFGLADDDHLRYAKKASNLDDLSNAATARTNLGLGTAAEQDSSAFDAVGAATAALNAAIAAAQALVDDLSGVSNQSQARTNLGLGTAATQPIGAFDATGAAAAAQAFAVQRGNHSGTQAQATIVNLVADMLAKADLVAGKVPESQLPSLVISQPFEVASQAAMLALTAQRGDVAIRSDLSKSFILSTDSPTTLADWKELLSPAGGVSTVNTRTGAVTGLAEQTDLTAEVNRATNAENARVTTAGRTANSVAASIAGSIADLPMGASTILARLAAGDIVAATPTQLWGILASVIWPLTHSGVAASDTAIALKVLADAADRLVVTHEGIRFGGGSGVYDAEVRRSDVSTVRVSPGAGGTSVTIEMAQHHVLDRYNRIVGGDGYGHWLFQSWGGTIIRFAGPILAWPGFAGVVPLTTKAAATGTANNQDWTDDAGVVKSAVTTDFEHWAPSFQAKGKTGATNTPVTLAGGTASGAPTTGAHVKGELVTDDLGRVWFCSVAGTPGTWLLVGQTHTGLGHAKPYYSAGVYTPPGRFAIASGSNLAWPLANRAFYSWFVLNETKTLDEIGVQVVAATAGGIIRVGVLRCDASWAITSVAYDPGTTLDASTTGVKTHSPALSLAPGKYWFIATGSSTALQVRYMSLSSTLQNGTDVQVAYDHHWRDGVNPSNVFAAVAPDGSASGSSNIVVSKWT